MYFLKFSAFIITHLIFTIFVLKAYIGKKDCVKFNSSQNYHQWGVIFSNSLSIFPAVMNYLQMSPGSCSYVFLILAKWSRYTHIKTLPTSHCSFTKPLLGNPHPLKPHYFIMKMLLKNITSVIIYLSIKQSISLSVCLSIYLSIYPSIHLSCFITTSVNTMVIFTYNCVFHSSILVSAGSQKYSLV